MSRRRKQKLPPVPQRAVIENLSHEGRGVARIDGKTVFIEGALPGEAVMFRYTRLHSRHDEGTTTEVLDASPLRVRPQCEYYGLCGGCSLQHLDPAAQIEHKQSVLLDDLQHIGKVQPQEILPPLTGPLWGYRQKARLGVRYVHKKGRVLVGFREKHSAFLADMHRCRILAPQVGERLDDLSAVIGQLSCYNQIAQIEVALGDECAALIFRHLVDLTDADREILSGFGRQFDFQIYLQPKGPDSVHLLWPDTATLSYRLPAQDVTLEFRPNDFVQVNNAINRDMVTLAIDLLEPSATDRVLELFCGLGNFSLPLAKQVSQVVAVEGEAGLVEQARQNAQRNNIGNIEFHTANLVDEVRDQPWLHQQRYDKILLDPPRSGAVELIPQLAETRTNRVVYVSCNPATLARDAGLLVNELGYQLVKAGVMDMFPHTAHVESIALFVRD